MTTPIHSSAKEIACGRNANECEDARTELLAARRTIEGMRQDAEDHRVGAAAVYAELTDWRSGKRAITPPEVAALSAKLANVEHNLVNATKTIQTLQHAIDSHIERNPSCGDGF